MKTLDELKELEGYVNWLSREYQLTDIEYRILVGMLRDKEISKEKLKKRAIEFD